MHRTVQHLPIMFQEIKDDPDTELFWIWLNAPRLAHFGFRDVTPGPSSVRLVRRADGSTVEETVPGELGSGEIVEHQIPAVCGINVWTRDAALRVFGPEVNAAPGAALAGYGLVTHDYEPAVKGRPELSRFDPLAADEHTCKEVIGMSASVGSLKAWKRLETRTRVADMIGDRLIALLAGKGAAPAHAGASDRAASELQKARDQLEAQAAKVAAMESAVAT